MHMQNNGVDNFYFQINPFLILSLFRINLFGRQIQKKSTFWANFAQLHSKICKQGMWFTVNYMSPNTCFKIQALHVIPTKEL